MIGRDGLIIRDIHITVLRTYVIGMRIITGIVNGNMLVKDGSTVLTKVDGIQVNMTVRIPITTDIIVPVRHLALTIMDVTGRETEIEKNVIGKDGETKRLIWDFGSVKRLCF